MTLRFLGQTYRANITEVAATPSKVAGIYRGVPVTFPKASFKTDVVPHSFVTLSYRGVHYIR